MPVGKRAMKIPFLGVNITIHGIFCILKGFIMVHMPFGEELSDVWQLRFGQEIGNASKCTGALSAMHIIKYWALALYIRLDGKVSDFFGKKRPLFFLFLGGKSWDRI